MESVDRLLEFLIGKRTSQRQRVSPAPISVRFRGRSCCWFTARARAKPQCIGRRRVAHLFQFAMLSRKKVRSERLAFPTGLARILGVKQFLRQTWLNEIDRGTSDLILLSTLTCTLTWQLKQSKSIEPPLECVLVRFPQDFHFTLFAIILFSAKCVSVQKRVLRNATWVDNGAPRECNNSNCDVPWSRVTMSES